MRKEIKNATITGIIIVAVVAGITGYLMSLDKPSTETVTNSSKIMSTEGNTSISSAQITPTVDESKYPTVPDLVGITGYVNTTPDELKASMKGKVVLYDFWTYSCINCIRTFPYLKAWNEKYADKGLVIVGIHSPEFEFEKDINNVKMAVEKYGLKYPVVLDSNHQTWDAFGNRYWPAEYITDDRGHIRHTNFGEGNYDETEKVIQQLLDERAQHLGLNINANEDLVNIKQHEFANQQTSELYFGSDFAFGRNFLGNSESFQPGKIVTYQMPNNLQQDHFYLDGQWQNFADSMQSVSDNAKITLSYYAKDVHIVASGNNTDIQIMLDGKPITSDYAGQDVTGGIAHISEHRLYNIVSSPQAGPHILTIIAKPGFEIYTFTFG